MIPIAKPWLGRAEAQAVSRVLKSGWITQGPEVAAFEKEFAGYVQSPHACAVTNCTSALHLALRMAGVGPGDEVVTVSHSFIATANAVRYTGAKPVFIDIEPGTFNMNPALLEQAVSSRTKAVLCVHQMGMPCDLRTIVAVGKKYGIPVVEDAACAVGSEILWQDRWERIGKPHGDAACFSFHPRKLLTTGDGGMLTTPHADWDRQFRLWRQHAMTVSDKARHDSRRVVFEGYAELGYNYRLTDLQAAVGRIQLKKLPAVLERRRRQVAHYRKRLGDLPEIGLPEEPLWARSNWQSFCVRLPDGTDQRTVLQLMSDLGIGCRRGVMCAHREQAYKVEPWSWGPEPDSCGCETETRLPLPASECAQDRSIQLPLFHQMTRAEQDRVVAALRRALRDIVFGS
jgi:perosamine synthetase